MNDCGKLPKPMCLGQETSEEDVSALVNAQESPEDFLVFLDAFNDAILEYFGQNVVNHLVVYKPNTSPDAKTWELLVEVESSKRPGEFVDAINEFSLEGFNDHPVDICRYGINRRIPKVQ